VTANKNIPFKPRARLILQLGDQLIRNENIALFELVKNAYDADASIVKIKMKNVDSKEKGEITIEDNGSGMDMDTIINAWMEPGTDFRAEQFRERKLSPIYKRLPIGEKGIGRFAAHKLGKVLEITTRKKGQLEIFVKIDWRIFEEKKYLSNIKIKVQEREPQLFTKKKTGTHIRITNLRNEWEDRKIRSAYRAITSISNPFPFGKSSFEVKFSCPDNPEALENLLQPKDIQKLALWHATGWLEGTELEIKFKFTPWPEMEDNIKSRRKKIVGPLLDPYKRKATHIDLNNYKIGSLRLELYVFDRDPNILKLLFSGVNQLKSYLDSNGGIRVYRDGIRVYDYGEQGNDWLDLDLRRVNSPTKRISNNLVIGAVFLDRDESESLIEKTNREGFIENDAYELFRKAVLYSISKFENERYIDKLKLRTIFGPEEKSEPVQATFDELRTKLKEKIKDGYLLEEIITYVDKAEKEYNDIKDNLLKSSGAGLSLSVVIHEFEKIIKELIKVLEREEASEKILILVHRLSDLTEGFTSLIRSGRRKNNDLKEIIKQSLFNMEYRLKAHKIDVIDNFSEIKWNTKVRCTRNYVLMVIMNIIDNSIWWLGYKYKEKEGIKKIYITLKRSDDGINLLIADNGPGFSVPTDIAIKPFVSDKPGGMGLGLYIADEIMKAHKGTLFFPTKKMVKLPPKINGAIVGLHFKG
jgi:anti-sigma regulatory factor (Ser/Thr protein kinase)